MATFRTYAEALRPDHPLMKIHEAARTWRPSRYRTAEIERVVRAEPGVVLEDIREIAELTSDEELLRIADLAEVPVSLEHLRPVDPQTRILIGYRLDVTAAESPRLRRRLALPPDPAITLHFGEVPFPDATGKFWGAMRRDTPGLNASGPSAVSA